MRRVIRKWRRVPDLNSLRSVGMTIGSNVSAMHNVFLDPGRPWLLSIGDDVIISFNVSVLTHDASALLQTGYSRLAPVSIGSRVFIGAHAVILPGVTIGDDAVIGAGSVVSHDVPSGTVAAGSPARKIADISSWRSREFARIAASPRWRPEELPSVVRAGEAPLGASASELSAGGGHGYVGREEMQHDPDAVQATVERQIFPSL